MAYECRHCGYEPDERELRRGTCPQCRWHRQLDRLDDEMKTAIDEEDAPALIKIAERYKRLEAPWEARKALDAAGKIVRPSWSAASNEAKRDFYTILRARLAA